MTYASVTDFTIGGSFPAKYYSGIQVDGVDAGIRFQVAPNNYRLVPDLVLYKDALGDNRFYFAVGTSSNFIGFLDENTLLGSTVPSYTIVNGSVTSTDNRAVYDCIPEDYFDAVESGEYTLTPRS